MLSVKHKITIGGSTFSLGNETRLLDLKMQASLDVPVNVCRIRLGPTQDLNLKAEDKVSVELGYGEEMTKVFSGTVGAIDWGIKHLTVYAASVFQTLIAARLNLVYEEPQGGDIASDVAAKLKLSKGKVEPGLTFAAYALGENQTVYEQLRTLARQCGFDLYADPEDKLVFAKYSPATPHEFGYGTDILSFALDEQTVPLTGVEVYGESPASHGQGTEASSWLTKKDVKGSAGGKKGLVMRMADPTARTTNAAGKIAEAMLAAGASKQVGTMTVLGSPAVGLGDAVKISDMPNSLQNGTFKVTGVTHALNPTRGFVTAISVQELT